MDVQDGRFSIMDSSAHLSALLLSCECCDLLLLFADTRTAFCLQTFQLVLCFSLRALSAHMLL